MHKKHFSQDYGRTVVNHLSDQTYTGTLTVFDHKNYSNLISKTLVLTDGNWFGFWHWKSLLTTFSTLLVKVLVFNIYANFFVNGNAVSNRWVNSKQVGNGNHHDHHHTHDCFFLRHFSDFYLTLTVVIGLQTNSQASDQSFFSLCFNTHYGFCYENTIHCTF